MIDWVLTKEKFNIISVDGYRPKVICKCDKCGKEKVITIRIKAKVVGGQMPWECAKCVSNKPANVKKMKDIRNKKVKPDPLNKIYYNNNKEHLLEKSRVRRRKTSKTCNGCKKLLSIKQFYCNATYIAKYCLPCEEQHKLSRDRVVSLYKQDYVTKNRSKRPKNYNGTTVEACYRYNFNNIYGPSLKRCNTLKIKNEVELSDYKLILNNHISKHDELKCDYCMKLIHVFCFEHMDPLSRGGRHHKSNITISCVRCNTSKHNLTRKEFQFKLNNIVLFEQQKTLKNTLYVDSTNIPQMWKYPIWSDSELNNDFERIIKYKPIGKFKQTVSTPYGYKIVKHFHKSFWHSAPKNCHPIVNAFVDTKAISNLLNKLNDNRRLSYRRLLREIFFNTNYKYPSIFATHLAIEILAKYSKPGDVVYDPCAGWGNRWLASLNNNLCINYHCSEPNEHIRKENVLIASYFKQKISIDGKAIGDGTPNIKSDIIFTSPPWGDTEYYHAGGEVKSTLLDSLLLESSESLKDDGVLILHLPHPPANWPDPDEIIEAHARSRYRGNSVSSVFIWKANTIKSFKVF